MGLSQDYARIREGAALVIPRDRARIAVSGGDRRSYLHGLLTNDTQALAPGTGCYASWLTPQGRMTTDMHVLEAGDMILLDVPAAARESLLQRLEQFVFTEDIQLGDLTDTLGQVAVHGPRAAAVIQQAISGDHGLDDWPQYHNARADFGGAPVVIARIDQLGVPGFTHYVDLDSEGALIAALEGAGASRVSEEAVTAARVEAGYPLFGIDMNDDTIPLEAGIEGRAISLTKGCYVGQEVIIRVLHRGHGRVVRRLVGLRMRGGAVPAASARIHAAGRDVGFITSSARHPLLDAIALGYVHRDFVEPGTAVEVDTAGGPATATVTTLPFPSES